MAVAGDNPLSVPAQFEKYLSPPGHVDQFLRPNSIYFDSKFGELYVIDPGHNRIAIFDRSGNFKFEFTGGEHFSTPTGLTVDNQGRIFVLGGTTQGRRVFTFDFDGLFLQDLTVKNPDGLSFDFSSIAVDNGNHLYGLDEKTVRVVVFDESGTIERTFPVFQNNENIQNEEQVFGTISVKGDLLYVPIASLGTVHVYDLSGRFVRSIGYKGNDIGELNFPVAVASVDNKLILVLDKHRFNVVCFDSNGKFMGEFGGKGSSPGWFYHPTSLAVNDANSVFIGQLYMNRVQMCRIPEFVLGAAGSTISGEVSVRPSIDEPELYNNHHLTSKEEVSQATDIQILSQPNSNESKRNHEDYDH